MFVESRENVLKVIKKLQEKHCGYVGDRCDCKYGGSFQDEQTGCPELRCIIKLLENLNDEEYEQYLKGPKDHLSKKDKAKIRQIVAKCLNEIL